jgi:hypothetical protein
VALTPSAWLSQNEIDAAKTVRMSELNVQGQPKLVWPASFVLARAYVDQLERGKTLSGDRIAALRRGLASAEKANGDARREALTALATQLDSDAGAATGANTVRKLQGTVRDLAAGTTA